MHDVADLFRGRRRAGGILVVDDDDVICLGGIFGVFPLHRFRRLGQINHIRDVGDDEEEEAKGGDAGFGEDDDQPIKGEVDRFVLIASKEEREERNGSFIANPFVLGDVVGKENDDAKGGEDCAKQQEEDRHGQTARPLVHANDDDVNNEEDQNEGQYAKDGP